MIRGLIDRFRRNKRKEREEKVLKIKKKLSQTLYPNSVQEVKEITEYERDGHLLKLGDRVICRSNECDPLMFGEIVEFWTNNGRWDKPLVQVKDEKDDQVWSVMGIIRPYSDELVEILSPLKPLEQWNYFVDDIHKYSKEEMERKELKYEIVQKNREHIHQ